MIATRKPMAKDKTSFEGWHVVDWFDLLPEPGSFVSSTWDDYEVHGEVVRALNWLHAEHTWLQRQIKESDEEFGRCCHCNQPIRYAVVYRDGNGHHHLVGQTCSGFVGSGLDRPEWLEKRLISTMKEVETKRGKRWVLSMDVPGWYWDVPRARRPSYASLSSYERPNGRGKVKVWSLSIWGDTPHDVIRNIADFRRYRPIGI